MLLDQRQSQRLAQVIEGKLSALKATLAKVRILFTVQIGVLG